MSKAGHRQAGPGAPAASTIDGAALRDAARAELARLPAILDGLTAGLDDAGWRQRPAPAEWAPLEILCHLRDEEVEDFGARLRVVLEGGTRFAPIDPPGWLEARGYRQADPRQVLDALGAARAATLRLLDSTAPGALAHAVEHGAWGRLDGLDLLAAWVAHDRLHLQQLAATLARLWATRWAPLRADYAGPIPFEPDAGA